MKSRSAIYFAACAWLSLGVPASRAIDDLTAHCQFIASGERTTLDRATGRLISQVDVRLINLGGRTLLNPLQCTATLSTGGVDMADAVIGQDGIPYVDLSSRVPNGRLLNGGEISFTLVFSRPRSVVFTYSLGLRGNVEAVHPPVLHIDPLSYRVQAGQALTIPFTADDADGDAVVLSCGTSLSNLAVAVTNGVSAAGSLVFRPAMDQTGIYLVDLGARDPLGYEDREAVTITVDKVNRAPELADPGAIAGNEGELLTTQLSGSDPDGDALQFIATGLPSNAVVNPEQGSFFFAPDFNQAGAYDVDVSVTDGMLTSATKRLTIAVEDVSGGGEQPTNQLNLVVDPIQSPTLQTVQRITGRVNGDTNAPSAEPIRCAVISGLVPSTGEQGETLDIVLTGAGFGSFATHFSPGSSANFGAGIAVNALTASGTTQLTANISIASNAALGPRAVTVSSGKETAVSVVAFNVQAGGADLSGRLIDGATSNALAGAIVTLEGTGYSTTTGPNGSFSFHGLPPGDYRITINSPDHGLITMTVNMNAGQVLSLGNMSTATTIFDPAAPATVSPLSILWRGSGQFGIANVDQARQTVRDTLLLLGGSDAGILDENGQQLNPLISGMGLVSLSPDGTDNIALRMQRGDSIAIADLLYSFSFAFRWTNGPPLTLYEWISGLQQGVNAAWADPTNPDNYLPLIVFNHDARLTSEPPTISPMTRLNPLQAWVFMVSMLSYMADPNGTNQPLAQVKTQFSTATGVGTTTEPPSGRRWTSYWRGMNGIKDNFMTLSLNSAVDDYGMMAMMNIGVVAAGSVNLGLAMAPLTIMGLLETKLALTFGAIELAAQVPEPPMIISATVTNIPKVIHGSTATVQRVIVKIRRSPRDLGNDARYLYVLYRFRNYNEGRQLVGYGSTNDTPVRIVDLEPMPGSSFYAATVVRLFRPDQMLTDNAMNDALPWWNMQVTGVNDPTLTFLRSTEKLISDYSDPVLVYVGPETANVPINQIEINETDNSVYYAFAATNINDQVIDKIENLGAGDRSQLAGLGFAAPGFDGLAIDNQGDLYSHNKASDAMFGGRIFKYGKNDGLRTHVGQINYYSQDIMFANPVDARTLSMGPAESGESNAQDLYTFDLISGLIKRIPVQATRDPYRRVGQIFADIPLSGRPVDMEHDRDGDTYLLLADAIPRVPFNDREKGPMHRPPGTPVKNDCPPDQANPNVDPVYLFSGEYYEDDEDIRIKGCGLDFVWTRKYRSKIGVNTVQGNNWDYSYNIYIDPPSAGNGGITVHDGHTRSDEYLPTGDGITWTRREFFCELTRNPDWSYTLKYEDGGFWKFNGFSGAKTDGRIMESVDRHGNRLLFHYDTNGRLDVVTDTLDRDIRMAYNSFGMLESISDFAGRVWKYEYYDGTMPGGNLGDLKSFTTPAVTGQPGGNGFPAGKTTKYTYSVGNAEPRLNGNLLTVTDPMGQVWLQNVYSSTTNSSDFMFDRVVRQLWGGPNDIIDITYLQVNPTAGNGRAVVRAILNDRLGHVQEYFYNANNQCTIEREYTGTADPARPTTATDNRPGGKLRPTDPQYFETRYMWNDDSMKTRVVHPNGNITEYVYESDLDPTAPARTRGNIRKIRHLPGTHLPAGDQAVIEEEYEYDTSYGRGCCGFNFATMQSDGMGNRTLKSYDQFGNMTQVVNRISSVVENYEYNEYGEVTRVVSPDNGSGHRRVDRMVYYDSGPHRGFLREKIVDEGGLNLSTKYEYDLLGNITRVIDSLGNDTLFTYNQLNQVVRTLTQETGPGSGIRYAVDTYYDANDNVIRVERENRDEEGVLRTNAFITRTMEYEILNAMTRETCEVDDGHVITTEYQYDKNRNRVLVRNPVAVNGSQPHNTVRKIFDERGLTYRTISAEESPVQHTFQADYDGNQNMIRTLDGVESDPAIETTEYDGYDRRIKSTDALGNVKEWRYDANHNPLQYSVYGEMRDVPGGTSNVLLSRVSCVYDAMGRKIRQAAAFFDPATQVPLDDGEVVTSNIYNDCSQIICSRDDNGHMLWTSYDHANRVRSITDHLGNTITTTYDANGNVLYREQTDIPDSGGDPEIYVFSNRYDGLNRCVYQVDSGGNARQYFFDSLGNPTRIIDARGNLAFNEFDGLGRLIKTTATLTSDGTGAGTPAGSVQSALTWDDSSRATSRVDDNGNATSYSYDDQDRVIATTHADGRMTRQNYDRRGNTESIIDANGTIVHYAYDALDRVTNKVIQVSVGISTSTTHEAFCYDGLSRIIEGQNDAAKVEYSYDSLSRVMSEALNGLRTEYRHDGTGNLLACTYPGGRAITNKYDALNRCKTTADADGLVASYNYVGPMRLAGRINGNGTETRYQYDRAQRVSRITHLLSNGTSTVVFDDRKYAWDAMYNKTIREDLIAGVTNQYSYDSLNRLIRSVRNGGIAREYRLDGVGNRTNVVGGGDGGVYSMLADTPEPADRQMNQYSATPFDERAYDSNGNAVKFEESPSVARSMIYDYRDRLVEYRDPESSVVVTYKYDVFDRRIERCMESPTSTVERYCYQGDNLIEARDETNAIIATYAHAPFMDDRVSMRRAGVDIYYHGDDQRNILKLTDMGGEVIEQYDYDDYGYPHIFDAHGNAIGQTRVGNCYLFNGREYDQESGFYCYRKRYLDPHAGSFLSRDRRGAWGDSVNLGNAHAYVGSNPWSRVDPMGDESDYAGGAVAGVVQTGVNTVNGAIEGGVQAIRDPVGTVNGAWNGLGAAMNKVAFNPRGIIAGYAELLFPEILRKGRCWEYLSEYERGKATGMASADIIIKAVTIQQTPGAIASGIWYAHGRLFHRRLGQYKSTAEFNRSGYLYARQEKALAEVAELAGHDIFVVGMNAETPAGIAARANKAVREIMMNDKSMAWRAEKSQSNAILYDKADLDIWLPEKFASSPEHVNFIRTAIESKLPEFKGNVDFYVKEYNPAYAKFITAKERVPMLRVSPEGASRVSYPRWSEIDVKGKGK